MTNSDTDLVTVGNELQLSGNPQEVQAAIEAFSESHHAHLDQAWTMLQEGSTDIEAINNHIVAADQEMWKISQIGAMSVAGLAGMSEAIKVVAEQRDELFKANERIIKERDEIQEEYDGLQQSFHETVNERIMMEFDEMDPYDFFDVDQLVSEAEDNFIGDVELNVRHLNSEGDEQGADALAEALAIYTEARQTLIDSDRDVQQKLLEMSNKRRIAKGAGPVSWYTPIQNVISVDDDEDPDEDEDEDSDDVAF